MSFKFSCRDFIKFFKRFEICKIRKLERLINWEDENWLRWKWIKKQACSRQQPWHPTQQQQQWVLPKICGLSEHNPPRQITHRQKPKNAPSTSANSSAALSVFAIGLKGKWKSLELKISGGIRCPKSNFSDVFGWNWNAWAELGEMCRGRRKSG